MDKTAIKKFAVNARTDLIEQIKLKARSVGVTADKIYKKTEASTHEIEYYQLDNTSEQNAITGKDIVKRQKLVSELRQREQKSDLTTAFNDLVVQCVLLNHTLFGHANLKGWKPLNLDIYL